MATISEGRLRLLKALAFLSFFILFSSLVAVYAYLQDPIAMPIWSSVLGSSPSKAGVFYVGIGVLAVVFFANSWFSRLLKKMPKSRETKVNILGGLSVDSLHAFTWLTVWNALVFLSVNLFLTGLILKVWELNNADMSFLSTGITFIIMLGLVLFIFGFTLPLIRLINAKS